MKNVLFLFVALLFIGITQAQLNPPSVKIGNQTWMVKNLDVNHYRNGDSIPQVKDPAAWASLTTGAWCYYSNKSANGKIYGKLYNWYAVNDPRGLAPEGWHIPNESDWTNLTDQLGGYNVAGNKMKSTKYWKSAKSAATNSSGFTALPGGCRDNDGAFVEIGSVGHWWNSIWSSASTSFARQLDSYGHVLWGDYDNRMGYSVRCIKD
jgi:uncharacterized protein (TIGR02145 family)